MYKTVFLSTLEIIRADGHTLKHIAYKLGCLRTQHQAQMLFCDVASLRDEDQKKLFILVPTGDKILYMEYADNEWNYEEVGLEQVFNITNRAVMLIDAPTPILKRPSRRPRR